MVIFSNCKINLGLQIVAKRPDGYHELETVFYPIPFYDVIEIVPSPAFAFSYSGLLIPGPSENNLCLKAYRLLKKDFVNLPEIKLHLHKNIPMGAGLGGGSANASYTLILLNQKFTLNLSAEQLKYYAVQLGSDCSFFIENKPCYATGRGELLSPVDCDLSNHTILLLLPGIHVNTADAFSGVLPKKPVLSVLETIKKPIASWKDNLKNDFEVSVFKLFPDLEKLKEKLYDIGAKYAAMSGSGSTIYGIFEKEGFNTIDLSNNFRNIRYKVL